MSKERLLIAILKQKQDKAEEAKKYKTSDKRYSKFI